MKIPSMGNMMQQVQKMQESMQKAEAALANIEVIGEAGAGLVKVTFTANYDCKKINIEDSLLEEEKEILEDLVTAAINDGLRKIETTKKDKLSGLTTDFNIPGGLDALLK